MIACRISSSPPFPAPQVYAIRTGPRVHRSDRSRLMRAPTLPAFRAAEVDGNVDEVYRRRQKRRARSEEWRGLSTWAAQRELRRVPVRLVPSEDRGSQSSPGNPVAIY